MEHAEIRLDDAARFDEVLRDSLPEGGDLEVITKDGATEGGAPAVMLTWTVRLPDGSLRRVQAVTTVRLLAGVCAALKGRYPDVIF